MSHLNNTKNKHPIIRGYKFGIRANRPSFRDFRVIIRIKVMRIKASRNEFTKLETT
jgi:hypothetical protein